MYVGDVLRGSERELIPEASASAEASYPARSPPASAEAHSAAATYAAATVDSVSGCATARSKLQRS